MRARALLDAGVDVIVVDSAHGHSEGVLETIATLREAFPDAQLVGGNVATEAGARALVERGVDAIKVGIGPGSICTTRVVTGVGVPQITAIIDAVRGAGDVPVIADGGIKYSGDVVKALAAGAPRVMMGSMLAGTEESPGESILAEGRRFKMIRGMGSLSRDAGRLRRSLLPGRRGLAPRSWSPRASRGGCPTRGRSPTSSSRWSAGCGAEWGTAASATSPRSAATPSSSRSPRPGLRESHPHDVTITQGSTQLPEVM